MNKNYHRTSLSVTLGLHRNYIYKELSQKELFCSVTLLIHRHFPYKYLDIMVFPTYHALISSCMILFSVNGNLTLTTYYLPLTTNHLPFTIYNSEFTVYHLPLTTYHLTFTTHNLQLTN